eukprot:SAG22_NODE_2191_length_2860_cov_22.131112_5_plen_49_part_01
MLLRRNNNKNNTRNKRTNNNNLGKKELANWWECRELAVSAAARSRPNTP